MLRLLARGDTANVSRELHIADGTVSNGVTRILQKLRARR
ncbi:LuxR C-terminal-related transcriptional regulator [Amycolatopsis sp. lyj-108]